MGMSHRFLAQWFLNQDRMNQRDSWCWVFDHWIHQVDLNSKEQSQSIRTVLRLDSDSDTVVVAELEVAGLKILWSGGKVWMGWSWGYWWILYAVNLNFELLNRSLRIPSFLFSIPPALIWCMSWFSTNWASWFSFAALGPVLTFWPWPQLTFCWFWLHDQVVHWPLPFDLVLPFSFWLAFLILKWRGPFWSFAFLSFWLLTFAFAFLEGIDLGLLWLIELIDGLEVYRNCIVEVVDQKCMNLRPCCGIADADIEGLSKVPFDILKC